MKTVLIEWVDSQFQPNEWSKKCQIEEVKSPTCISVGVILAETEDNILICPNLSGEQGAQGLTIPKSSIRRMRQLKVGS